MRFISIAIFTMLVACSSNLFSQSDQPYRVETVFQTKGVIWGFDFLPDQKIIYTKRKGEVWVFDSKTKSQTLLNGTPNVFASGQGGMLDVRVHPNYKTHPWIYLSYSVVNQRVKETRIARAKISADELTNLEVLFTSASGSTESRHFGSRIVFDQKGHIFFSVGDRGERKHAQDLYKDHGKVYRIHEDGSIPKDNPFVSRKGVNPAIWSYGHRNPQGLYYDHKTQILWEQEHGPRGGDEINQIHKGKNYGWPIITYGREYHGPKIGEGITTRNGMEQPLYYFVPSIAPSGLSVYTGKQFPSLQGAFLSGALAKQHVNILFQEKGRWKEKRWLTELDERIRNVFVRKGMIYVSTDTGKLIRLSNSQPSR